MPGTCKANELHGDTTVMRLQDVEAHTKQVARDAVQAYQMMTTGATEEAHPTAKAAPKETNSMINPETTEAIAAIKNEAAISAKLMTGEVLLDNITTIATNLVMSRLSWWQKLAISEKQKTIAVTAAIYVIVHAVKSGGFGLAGYSVNHAALDYVTLAANKRILGFVMDATGVDTNVAGMLFKAPTVEAS